MAAGHRNPDSPEAAAILSLRGTAVSMLNDLEDSPALAISLGRAVLADRERMLGADHPDTLNCRDNLPAGDGRPGLPGPPSRPGFRKASFPPVEEVGHAAVQVNIQNTPDRSVSAAGRPPGRAYPDEW